MFFKRGRLKKIVKLTGRHLCRNLLLNKAASFRPAILCKSRLRHTTFSLNFAKFLIEFFSCRKYPVAASFVRSLTTRALTFQNKLCHLLQ